MTSKEICKTNPNCEIKPSNCEYAVRCTTYEDLSKNKEVYVCGINNCKEITGDKEMEKSKIVEEIDYDKEVDTLLKMGGQKALENQYKNISRRLDVISGENRRLRLIVKEFEDSIGKLAHDVKRYEEELSTLRTRCTDSARDMFDKKMYGCLSVVRGRKELDCVLKFDSPLDFAKSLIEHCTHVDECKIKTDTLNYTVPENDKETFDYDQLEENAEYLLTYCKHNKEDL